MVQKRYTIANLRLNVEAAEEGKPWLLLPEGFQNAEAGRTYPLPSNYKQLQRLCSIEILPQQNDSGTIYLKRCMAKWKEGQRRRISALGDTENKKHAIVQQQYYLRQDMKNLKAEAQEAVNLVKLEAEKQIANLTDLFALGREGIAGQMRAHLDQAKWKGEDISARDFRECFRMVSQAVHALGLPSGERAKAREVVMAEAAAAAGATKGALALAPRRKAPEVQH